MSSDPDTRQDGAAVTTVCVGLHARVIVLRGAIGERALEELRTQLHAAIEAGVRELFIDVSDAETITSQVHELVTAASLTLADRGGVLLAWGRKHAGDDPTYVMAEVRDRALGDLMPRRHEPDRGSRSCS